MKDLIRRIMQSRYRFAFVGFIIILIVFVVGATTIISLNDTIENSDISYINLLVKDKYVDDNMHHYVVIDDRLHSFIISNDKEGSKMFEKMQVGQRYNIVVHELPNNSEVQVIQVYNATD